MARPIIMMPGERARYEKWSNWQSKVLTGLALLLVNGVAFAGQLGWAHQHLKEWSTLGQVLFACALESVAVVVGYHAYIAELANDSAGRLKIASYGIGLLVGALNASHYSHNGKPTAVGITVGIMSASSPWLWGMFSRRVSRRKLVANGLVEPHALRLGMTRWMWHPIRSAQVMYQATWLGLNVPSQAISHWQEVKETRELHQEFEAIEQ